MSTLPMLSTAKPCEEICPETGVLTVRVAACHSWMKSEEASAMKTLPEPSTATADGSFSPESRLSLSVWLVAFHSTTSP